GPDVTLYLDHVHPDRVTLAGGRPPTIALGALWVTQADPLQLKFVLGCALGRARAGLLAAFHLPADELGRLPAALIQVETGSLLPPYSKDELEPIARRLAKTLPKKLLRELGPYALELSGANFQPLLWKRALEATAVRAGMLVCADVPAALESALRLDAGW